MGNAEVLLTQPLQRLVLSDLHTGAHIAVAVYKEVEGTRQMLAVQSMLKTEIRGSVHNINPVGFQTQIKNLLRSTFGCQSTYHTENLHIEQL